MSQRSVVHGTFNLERTYPHPPAKVYAAFATEEGKAGWFAGGEGYALVERAFDFREGGHERLAGRWESGLISRFDAIYFDIVPETRIVYAYEMHLDDTKISVSLATLQFEATPGGTRLLLSETGAFLDGYDDADKREHGTNILMDRVGAYLASLP